MSFGRKIKEARLLRNLTSNDLAKKTGVSRSYISLIETGRRLPKKQRLQKIARILHISKDVIVEWYIAELEKELKKVNL